eukprot:7167222-Ditylum_brightwellii.AAC.1
MACASIGFVGIHHHNDGCVIFVYHGGTMLDDTKFVEDGAEILGHLRCRDILEKFSLSEACGNSDLPFCCVGNCWSSKKGNLSTNGSAAFEICCMCGININPELMSLIRTNKT